MDPGTDADERDGPMQPPPGALPQVALAPAPTLAAPTAEVSLAVRTAGEVGRVCTGAESRGRSLAQTARTCLYVLQAEQMGSADLEPAALQALRVCAQPCQSDPTEGVDRQRVHDMAQHILTRAAAKHFFGSHDTATFDAFCDQYARDAAAACERGLPAETFRAWVGLRQDAADAILLARIFAGLARAHDVTCLERALQDGIDGGLPPSRLFMLRTLSDRIIEDAARSSYEASGEAEGAVPEIFVERYRSQLRAARHQGEGEPDLLRLLRSVAISLRRRRGLFAGTLSTASNRDTKTSGGGSAGAQPQGTAMPGPAGKDLLERGALRKLDAEIERGARMDWFRRLDAGSEKASLEQKRMGEVVARRESLEHDELHDLDEDAPRKWPMRPIV